MNMRHALRIILSIATLGIASSAVASDTGNPVQGRQLFSRCSGCHSVKGENKSGPPLNGVVGRKAASIESYRYSTALATSGVIWSEEELSDSQVLVARIGLRCRGAMKHGTGLPRRFH